MRKLTTRTRESRINKYQQAVLKVHGPSPVNLFKELRESHGYTLIEFANLVGLSKMAIIRFEQGVPVSPIEAVVDFWVNHPVSPQKWADLDGGYFEYQKAMRLRHAMMFGPMPSLQDFADNVTVHPFQILLDQWTNPETGEILGTMNPTEFAKLACFPQGVGDHFLSKVHRQQSVPKQLSTCFYDLGYDASAVGTFERAYTNHRNWVTDKAAPIVSNVVAPKMINSKRNSVKTSDKSHWMDSLKAAAFEDLL